MTGQLPTWVFPREPSQMTGLFEWTKPLAR